MEAMAAAEQAIELASDAASAHSRTQAASDTQQQPEPALAHPCSATASTNATQPHATESPTGAGHAGEQHQHGGNALEPIANVRQRSKLQQHQASQQSVQRAASHGGESEPLIAKPEGLLRVSVNQRPAKQHFDRSALA